MITIHFGIWAVSNKENGLLPRGHLTAVLTPITAKFLVRRLMLIYRPLGYPRLISYHSILVQRPAGERQHTHN